jgi:integrase
MERHAYSTIGAIFVDQIDTPMVLKILEPLWEAKKIATARMLGHDIKDVLDFATFKEYRKGDNPALMKGRIATIAPKAGQTKHHASIEFKDLPAFMVKLRNTGSRRGITIEAQTLQILTVNRPGAILGAPWTEITDYKKTKVWRIPKERMKADRDHFVPLSDPAIAILEKMERVAEGEYVFPGRAAGSHLTEGSLLAVLDRMGLHGHATSHGFRATFRSWGDAETEKLLEKYSEGGIQYRMYLLEICLAHDAAKVVGANSELLKAYQRDGLVEQRRPIMDEWAKFVMSQLGSPQDDKDELAEAAE